MKAYYDNLYDYTNANKIFVKIRDMDGSRDAV